MDTWDKIFPVLQASTKGRYFSFHLSFFIFHFKLWSQSCRPILNNDIAAHSNSSIQDFFRAQSGCRTEEDSRCSTLCQPKELMNANAKSSHASRARSHALNSTTETASIRDGRLHVRDVEGCRDARGWTSAWWLLLGARRKGGCRESLSRVDVCTITEVGYWHFEPMLLSFKYWAKGTPVFPRHTGAIVSFLLPHWCLRLGRSTLDGSLHESIRIELDWII